MRAAGSAEPVPDDVDTDQIFSRLQAPVPLAAKALWRPEQALMLGDKKLGPFPGLLMRGVPCWGVSER
jgi:hypothetical protein